MKNSMYISNQLALFITVLILILISSLVAAQDDKPVIVNVDNFVRAETASQIDRGIKMLGLKVNTWAQWRAYALGS